MVSAIDNLMASPKGRAQVYKCFQEDTQGNIWVTTANSNNTPYKFNRFDSKQYHSFDKNGLTMLEQTYAYHEWRNAAYKGKVSETIIMHNISGGYIGEPIKALIDNNLLVASVSDVSAMEKVIINYANNPDILVNFGTLHAPGKTHHDYLNAKYDVHYRHAYTIKGFDSSTNMVVISNPWHSGVDIKIPMNELFRCTDQMTVVHL